MTSADGVVERGHRPSRLTLDPRRQLRLGASLLRATAVELRLSFALLGDSLLNVAAAQAIRHYLPLLGRRIPVVAAGPRADLLAHARGVEPPRSLEASSTVLITDGDEPEDERYLVRLALHRIRLPARLVAGRWIVARPTLLYLFIEAELGRQLPWPDRAELPPFIFDVAPGLDRLGVVIASTSLPEKKQFGVDRFLDVAAAVREAGGPERWVVVTGRNDPTELRRADVQVLRGIDAVLLGRVFAGAELVIGNDTGLTHLAALSQGPDRAPPTVVSIHSRHDPARWTTARPNVHAVMSPFARYLHEHRLSLFTDGVDEEPWGDDARASAINADEVVRACISALRGGRTQ